jgi:hypothetical protein
MVSRSIKKVLKGNPQLLVSPKCPVLVPKTKKKMFNALESNGNKFAFQQHRII